MKNLFLLLIVTMSVILITSCEESESNINFNVLEEEPNFRAEIGFNIPRDQKLSQIREVNFDLLVSPNEMSIQSVNINNWIQCTGATNVRIDTATYVTNRNMRHIKIEFENGIIPPPDDCIDVNEEVTVDLICTGVETPILDSQKTCLNYVQVSVINAVLKLENGNLVDLGQASYAHNNCK